MNTRTDAGLPSEATARAASPTKDSWQQELLEAYASVDDLWAAGLITADEKARLVSIGREYRVRLPRSYADLIDRSEGRASCPIRRQALPDLEEQDLILPDWARAWSQRAYGRETPWVGDPIGDLARLSAPRLTHRYANRAILHVSSSCAMYCRFCFRKSHLNDADRTLYSGDFEPALAYLAAHAEIREVILTGGDPLSLTDLALGRLIDRITALKHVRQVRIHSRMAATLPTRLTSTLASLLTNPSVKAVSSVKAPLVSLVSHFNHPRELTAAAIEGLSRLRRAGVPLYNQSVLLAGVNDTVDTLATLFQELYELGVRPFYLHHPDWTPATFHFRLPIARGRQLHRALRGRLSGPAIPEYVLDLPGGFGKVPLSDDDWLTPIEECRDGELGGALYAAATPQTRTPRTSGEASHATGAGLDRGRRLLYVDLWKG